MDEDDGRFVARAWRRWLGEVLARVTPLGDEEHVKVSGVFAQCQYLRRHDVLVQDDAQGTGWVTQGSDPQPLTSDRTKWGAPRPEPASDEMSTSTENDSVLPTSF
jgi:hypothetical protein